MRNKKLLLSQGRPMATVTLKVDELTHYRAYAICISFLDEGRKQWLSLSQGGQINETLQVPVGDRIEISAPEYSGITDAFYYDSADGAKLLLSEDRAYTFRIVQEKASIYLYTGWA